MPAQAAANILKLFTARLFCTVALRSFAKEKSEVCVERPAPSEASTAGSRVRRTFLPSPASSGTATYQSNVIRIHTSTERPPVTARRPPARPPSRRPPPQPGTTYPTKKRNPLAEDSRVLQWKEHHGEPRGHRHSGQRRLRRLRSTETCGAFREFQETRDCRGHVAPYLCG